MAEDVRQIRDAANDLIAKGKWDKALVELQKLARLDPKDIRVQIRIGDACKKLGNKAEAIAAYQKAAEAYSQTGYLIQAISVNKMILGIDPKHEQVQKALAALYSKQGVAQAGGGGATPASATSPAAPGGATPAKKEIPQVSFFSNLGREEFQEVIRKLKSRRYNAGELVAKEGEPGDSFFIISLGEVEVFRIEKGQRVHITTLQEGAFFGQYSFFSNTKRTASAVASVESEVLEVTKRDLKALMDEYPKIREALEAFYRDRVLSSIISNFPLFEPVEEAERKELATKFELVEAERGTAIIHEGDEGEAFYILRSGEAEVSKLNEKRRRVVLAALKDGDFFGEISLLTNQPCTATVTATKKSSLMRLSRDNFNEIILQHPYILETVSQYMEERIKANEVALKDSIAKDGAI